MGRSLLSTMCAQVLLCAWASSSSLAPSCCSDSFMRVAICKPAASSAAERVGLAPIDVSVSESDGHVTVTVRHRSATDVPLIGLAIGDVEVAATVTMRREPP